jgi:hypothetical protein
MLTLCEEEPSLEEGSIGSTKIANHPKVLRRVVKTRESVNCLTLFFS